MMNLLVTGGQGGIGQELLHQLRGAEGIRIVTLGRRPLRSGSVLPAHVRHETGSILDGTFLSGVVRSHGITHIIHAAGARTRECEESPLAAFESNVLGTDRIFLAARSCDTVQKILHLSTAAVYGRQLDTLTEDQPIAPASRYAVSKAASELAAFGRTEGARFQTVILRPAFVLGTRSRSSLSDFIYAALRKPEASLTMVDKFHVHWSADLVRVMMQFMAVDWPSPAAVYHPPGIDMNLQTLAAELHKAAALRHHQPKLRITPDPTAAVPASLDSSRLTALVGPFSLTPFSEMISQIAED